jgi:hypothetical protein
MMLMAVLDSAEELQEIVTGFILIDTEPSTSVLGLSFLGDKCHHVPPCNQHVKHTLDQCKIMPAWQGTNSERNAPIISMCMSYEEHRELKSVT